MSKYQTEQRKKLIAVFKDHPHQSFSAQELGHFLSDEHISTSAIYRNISEMVQEGLLCKVKDNYRSATLYQYMDPEHCEGIIHFKCQTCDNTFHLKRSISQMIIALAQEDFSFHVNGASAFLYGECNLCSKKQTIT